MAERKFKPGDRVRLIEMPSDGKNLTLKVGDIGIVARVDGVEVLVNWLRSWKEFKAGDVVGPVTVV